MLNAEELIQALEWLRGTRKLTPSIRDLLTRMDPSQRTTWNRACDKVDPYLFQHIDAPSSGSSN